MILSPEQYTEGRRACEEFVDQCRLELPDEVARLFEEYTRWIWQYKCPGAIYKYYSDETVIHSAGDKISKGTESVVASTLAFTASFPDRLDDFVDIFIEGDQEHGYHLGQTTCFNAVNTGWSQYGAPTGKSLERNGCKVRSICECKIEKVEGRWRVVEEWVVGSPDAIKETCTLDIGNKELPNKEEREKEEQRENKCTVFAVADNE